MFDTFKIERTATAPRPAKPRGRTGQWKALFASMKVGDWFVLDKKYYARTAQAANTHLKGKYRLYKHPENADKYILLLRNR